jgi:uncharacterized membrane protein YqjE
MSGSLFDSLRRLVEHLLALAQVRLELVTTELSLEIHRAARVLLWSFVALLCAGLGVLLLTLTIVIAVWEEHRLLAAGLASVVFLLAMLFAFWRVRAQLALRDRLLASSLAELQRDRDALAGLQR